MRLLIVDDDELTVKGLQKWIQGMNIQQLTHVDAAYSAEEALSYAHTWNVDILITDIQMVTMNGLELIQIMKKQDPKMECLIITAYASFEYAQQAIELGVRRFLLKPFAKEEIESAVTEAIRDRLNAEPETASVLPPEEYDGGSLVLWVRRYVQSHLDRDISMTLIANKANLSYSYFSRVFKEQTGMTFSTYVIDVKMKEAVRMLRDGLKTKDIAEKLGYSSPQNFNRVFSKYWKCSPHSFRNTGNG
ncbi:MAG: response regulator [Clostridia bacterium]|nr:response regulator [Clostridia bacterium]